MQARQKIFVKIIIFLIIISFLITGLIAFAADKKNPAPAPKPKCEKCYRGPDGKIHCDPVPCP